MSKKHKHLKYILIIIRQPQKSTLFPYTTLFRSTQGEDVSAQSSGMSELLAKLSPEQKEELKSLASNSRSEEHTSELQSRRDLVCRLLLVKKKFSLLVFSYVLQIQTA